MAEGPSESLRYGLVSKSGGRRPARFADWTEPCMSQQATPGREKFLNSEIERPLGRLIKTTSTSFRPPGTSLMGRKALPTLPKGFKTSGLYGRAQVDPQKPLNNIEKNRKRLREEKANKEAVDGSDSESDDDCGKKDGARTNWGNNIEIRFGSWIEKIPYKLNGETKFMAGCHPCKEAGATMGLGAKPTKRIKTYTFNEHQNSDEHKNVSSL